MQTPYPSLPIPSPPIPNLHPNQRRANSIEVCHNRLLSGYSYDAWSIDMCKHMTVECGGFSNYYCGECSEDVALEFELDEI